MRILFNYYVGGGGGFSNILELLKGFAENCLDAKIYVLDNGRSDFSTLSHYNNIELLKVRGGRGELARLRHGLWGLQKIAASINADVIWSVNLGGYLRGRTPQVISINNAYQVHPLPVLRLHPGGLLRASLLRLFSWLSIRASDGMILQTKRMSEYLDAYPHIPKLVASKAVCYQMSLSEPANISRELEKLLSAKSEGAILFLYVATLLPHKNHGTLIDAMGKLASSDNKIKLVLTVDPGELITAFGQTAEILIRNGDILPIGWLDKASLRKAYSICDACVMPSLLESLSSAHLEAMAWGKAQITVDLPYARELCGDAAVYVEPTAGAKWAAKMMEVAESPSLRKRLIEAGKVMSKSFPATWAPVAKAIFAFLQAASRSSLK